MSSFSLVDVTQILELHRTSVVRWHHQAIDNPYHGLLHTICAQHAFNFQLWHEEDKARCPQASDPQIAAVKRSIDKLNQQRNDWIERIDDQLAEMLAAADIVADDAPINTETPGSAIDRLSIMALRIYHLDEQLQRPDADRHHLNNVQVKLAMCLTQREELARSLERLLGDIAAGRVRHRTYRQCKMYNDPAYNPYLYNQPLRRAG